MALTRAMFEASDLSPLGLSITNNSGTLAFTGFLFIALSAINFVALALFLYKKP
jgi:hypothetical protein